MRVFLSWSGVRGKTVAQELERRLRRIVKGAHPWASPMIPDGENPFLELQEKLEESQLGIVCLTQTAMNNPWVHFEAGAVSKLRKQKARIWVLCLGFPIMDVPTYTPFFYLQRTGDSKEELLDLCKRMDAQIVSLGGTPTDAGDLVDAFEREWPGIEDSFAVGERRELEARDPNWYWRKQKKWDLDSIGRELQSLPAIMERVVREVQADIARGAGQREFWMEIDVEHPDLPGALNRLKSDGVLATWEFRGSAEVRMISNVGPVLLDIHLGSHGFGGRRLAEQPPGQARRFECWNLSDTANPDFQVALDKLMDDGTLAAWSLGDGGEARLFSNVERDTLVSRLAGLGFDARNYLVERPPWDTAS